MEKELLIVAEWKDKQAFHLLEKQVEENISHSGTTHYLFCLSSKKEIENIPKVPQVSFVTKQDFSLFGKFKSTKKQQLLADKRKVLIVAFDESTSLLKKVIKNTQILTVGIESEKLPTFDVAFKNTELKNGKFFQQLNNYLNKIKIA